MLLRPKAEGSTGLSRLWVALQSWEWSNPIKAGNVKMEISNAHLPSDSLRHNCNTTHLQLYTLPHLSPTLIHVLFVVHSRFEPFLRLLRRYITSTMLGIPIASE